MRPSFVYLLLASFLVPGCENDVSVVAREPEQVTIKGYSDDAMEVFITPDGRYMLFNNLNQSHVNTDIHFAEKESALIWQYKGKVEGINTPDLEGCPTVDRKGRLFFVSPRNYSSTLSTIYTGVFREGKVTEVKMVESISRMKPGIVNFDVEVNPDGQFLIFVDSRFKPEVGPETADLVIAKEQEVSSFEYLRAIESCERSTKGALCSTRRRFQRMDLSCILQGSTNPLVSRGQRFIERLVSIRTRHFPG